LPFKYDDIGNVFQNIFSHRAESFPYRVVQKLIDVYWSIDEQDEQDLQQSILHNKIDSVYQIVVEIIEKFNSEDRG